MDIRIDGKPLQARLKVVPERSFAGAEAALSARADGYDTIGATRPGGDHVLLLARTDHQLRLDQIVTIDGAPARVRFVENERNTARERALTSKWAIGGLVAGLVVGFPVATWAAFAIAGGVGHFLPIAMLAGALAAVPTLAGFFAGLGIARKTQGATPAPDEGPTDALAAFK